MTQPSPPRSASFPDQQVLPHTQDQHNAAPASPSSSSSSSSTSSTLGHGPSDVVDALDDTLPPDLRFQLTILGFLRFCETTAWTSAFPYAYFLMRDMPEHPPLDRVPFYASLVIACYTFAEVSPPLSTLCLYTTSLACLIWRYRCSFWATSLLHTSRTA